MNFEVIAIVVRVSDSVTAEWYVTHDNVELVVWKGRVLKAFYLHVRLRVEFCRNSAREIVEFHAVKSAALGYLFWHKAEEIARAHCRL